MKKTHWYQWFGIVLISTVIFHLGPGWAAAGETDAQTPERLVTMAVQYPAVSVPPDEDVSMDVIFYNKGRRGENVAVWIETRPEQWKARIKTYRYTVGSLHVPADSQKTLTFEAHPPQDIPDGDYAFEIAAETADGFFEMRQPIHVTIERMPAAARDDKGVKLTTSYPVIRGPSDAKFEFSVDVESELEQDAVFDLFAKGPEGWEINFKPAYETKYISSLRLKAGQNQSVDVEVKPAINAQAGKFPIQIRVSSGEAKTEAELMVILTGTYALDVGTASGLLSLDARQGKTASVSIYIENTGSAPNNNISFMSFKPENWTVEFEPEKIDRLPPGEIEQVDVRITPDKDALVGDYSVSLQIEGEKSKKPVEFRVSVKASSAWAWVGIAIIVLVIILLTIMFRKLGRR